MKLPLLMFIVIWYKSHPVRVRGLKLDYGSIKEPLDPSHPVRVRGLKHVDFYEPDLPIESHPVRVRGLKLNDVACYPLLPRRTPCRCVD